MKISWLVIVKSKSLHLLRKVGAIAHGWFGLSACGAAKATMHRVKGLEFQYVFVVTANIRIIPLASAINKSDNISEAESLAAGKCLLCVAHTRAQKGAYITNYGRKTEFLSVW